MANIAERMNQHALLGLDTSIFIYHFEAHPRYHPLTTTLLNGIEQGRWIGVTSVLTLMELNVRPLQLGREDIARKYEALIAHFPNLTLVDIDREVTRQAARLRANFQLRPADALQAAACCTVGATGFVTNDRGFSRLRGLLDVIIFDDFLM